MKPMNWIWLGTALPLLLAWWVLARPGHTRIDRAEAHRLVAAGAKLLDVRSPSEFGSGHLPSAINVPVQELQSRLKELEPKDQVLVIYCRSGHRSGIAFDQLKQAGFSRLYDLGPMSAW
jgi:phage shock protein E